MWIQWIAVCGLACGGCLSAPEWPKGTIVGCSMLVTPFGQSVSMWATRIAPERDEKDRTVKLTVEPTCRMTIEGAAYEREN